MAIAEGTIRHHFKKKIRAYRKMSGRDINLCIIPEDISFTDIDHILDIMLQHNYTFLSAYIKYKNPKARLIKISSLSVDNSLINSPPSQRKLDKKLTGVKLGYINNVTITSDMRIIDGYATFTLLKNNGENAIPCKYGKKGMDYKDGYYVLKMLYAKDPRCYICGIKTELCTDEIPNKATLDHIIPRSKGGSNDLSNLRLCCKLCNGLKSDIILTNKIKLSIADKSKQYKLNYTN